MPTQFHPASVNSVTSEPSNSNQPPIHGRASARSCCRVPCMFLSSPRPAIFALPTLVRDTVRALQGIFAPYLITLAAHLLSCVATLLQIEKNTTYGSPAKRLMWSTKLKEVFPLDKWVITTAYRDATLLNVFNMQGGAWYVIVIPRPCFLSRVPCRWCTLGKHSGDGRTPTWAAP